MKRINVLSKFVPLIISGDKDLTFRLKKEGEEITNTAIVGKGRTKVHYDFRKPFGIFKNNNFKFQVGETYSICVNNEPVWYCPKCKQKIKKKTIIDQYIDISIYSCNCIIPASLEICASTVKENEEIPMTVSPEPVEKKVIVTNELLFHAGLNAVKSEFVERWDWKPLERKVISIKEQKLLDVTNADAERSVGKGFKYPRRVLFMDFLECYEPELRNRFIELPDDLGDFERRKLESKIEEWNPSVWRIEI